MEFSARNRDAIIHRLRNETFDLVVIGGGITGAGIALDAAARGLRVALVEKNDFAFGTSSRSTKLIHGGLRYLKQFEFGLVKEVGSERAVVHNLAPHLVVPEKMLLPLHEERGLGYWLASIGLKLYDWLAGVKPEDQRRMLTRSQTIKAEPLLRKDGIKGGALYAEYRTDDARLTIEIIKAAFAHGAIVGNYLEAVNFAVTEGRIAAVEVEDRAGGTEKFFIQTTAVVNAAGPWVDQLRKANQSLFGRRLHLTKGVHIVVPRERLPVRQAIYFDVEEDSRMIFAIPRGRTTYVGTTDTNYVEDLDHVYANRDDAEYLIRAVNATFPDVRLTLADIESSWAGLRPLIHEDGKSTSDLSRKDEIFHSETGLISIAGGKLTGYRKMAERVVNTVVRVYFRDRKLSPCTTHSIPLGGAGFGSEKERREYERSTVATLGREGIKPYSATALVENFGIQSNEIISSYLTTEEADPEKRLLSAILDYCLHREMVVMLSDFFVRRTGLLYFDIAQVARNREWVARRMQHFLSWDDQRLASEIATVDDLLKRARPGD